MESIRASTAIDGYEVEPERAPKLVRQPDARVRNRNEREFAGYRDAMDGVMRAPPSESTFRAVGRTNVQDQGPTRRPPGHQRPTFRLALTELKATQEVKVAGTDQGAVWTRTDPERGVA